MGPSDSIFQLNRAGAEGSNQGVRLYLAMNVLQEASLSRNQFFDETDRGSQTSSDSSNLSIKIKVEDYRSSTFGLREPLVGNLSYLLK